MHDCNSSLVHTPSHAARAGAHDGNFQDLLPPRKRLLAGLKHVKANAGISRPLAPKFSASRQGGACTETTTTCPPPLPPRGLLLHSPTHKCFSCGNGSVLLHRVPCLAGSTSHLCSSCVLLSNKKLYCVLCFQIIKDGLLAPSSTSPPSFLTCCRCQRLTHLDCALKVWLPSLEGAVLTLCQECYTRNNGQSREPPTKKQKMASVRRSKQAIVSASKVKLPVVDKQALAAAKIVAITAKREAFEAKQRATVLAKAAALAAAHAKAALDSVYEVSQRKADKEEHSGVVDMDPSLQQYTHQVWSRTVDIESKNQVSLTTVKTSRGLKRRALSAIVASEILSRDLTMGNRSAKLEQLKKQQHTSSDADNGERVLSNQASMEATRHRSMQNAKLGIKRRKTLSSLTNTHAVASSKGFKSSKRSIGSSSSTKGKLGAIVSQVLALSKLSKAPNAAENEEDSGVCCDTLDDGVIDEIQKNACRTFTGSNACLPSSGTIVSIDACKPSHHDDVTTREEQMQSSKSFKDWMQCTKAMHTGSQGMIQEQLVKNRSGDCEAIRSQREDMVLKCLTKTMPAGKLMYCNGLTTGGGTLEG